jgi:hypothetical protein
MTFENKRKSFLRQYFLSKQKIIFFFLFWNTFISHLYTFYTWGFFGGSDQSFSYVDPRQSPLGICWKNTKNIKSIISFQYFYHKKHGMKSTQINSSLLPSSPDLYGGSSKVKKLKMLISLFLVIDYLRLFGRNHNLIFTNFRPKLLGQTNIQTSYFPKIKN